MEPNKVTQEPATAPENDMIDLRSAKERAFRADGISVIEEPVDLVHMSIDGIDLSELSDSELLTNDVVAILKAVGAPAQLLHHAS